MRQHHFGGNKAAKFQISAEGALSRSVKLAVFGGISGVALAPANALAQTAAPAAGDQPTELEKIEVTGSHIRRVDLETAAPVFTIDRSMIEASGVHTVGELVQDLPAISGAATNPRVNNGGGDGAATVSLRGLGDNRTLVLLNGRRMVSVTEAIDINAIPVNLIERVDVLKEGASAVYGSDAIAGVVNVITRKDFTGGDLSLDSGTSSRRDGDRKGIALSWGNATGHSNILMGLNYHDEDGISAGDRDFSKTALYLYSGVVTAGGSSRTPTGRFFLPASTFETSSDTNYDPAAPTARVFNCRSTASEARVAANGGDISTDQISVTRLKAASGATADAANYKCFTGADLFNYQPFNKILTPQVRTNLFTVANYDLSDKVEAYTEIFYNRTRSGFEIAPLPFDTRPDDVVISAQSMYNPFGISFGGADAVNPNATFRMVPLGTRRSSVETNTGQINLGLRGDVFSTPWSWTGGISVGRSNQVVDVQGYLFAPAMKDALGPSFADNNAGNFCGTPGTNPADPLGDGTPADPTDDATVVAGCTPLNIFNIPAMVADPAQKAQLDSASAGYSVEATRVQRIGSLNFSGPLLTMPAGQLQLAIGVERRDQTLTNEVDYLVTGTPPDFLTCRLAQETCTNATEGTLKVKEIYGELFVPILADLPAAHSLNMTLGTRWSEYNRFGSTTRSKAAMEYRPVQELLARASFEQVFRAPTVTDLFGAITANAPTFTDPCEGLTPAILAANPNLAAACQNVPTTGTFAEPNGQVTGRLMGNPALKPEKGDVITYGVVYDPDWAPGLSGVVDAWHYHIKDTIESLDVNTTAALCIQTQLPAFCNLINRNTDGTVNFIDQPTFNLGEITADGVDFGAKYNFPQTFLGKLRIGFDTTYYDKFERNAAPGISTPTNVAGQYSKQDGNFARVRANGYAQWAMAGFDVLVTPRYISHIVVKDPDGALGANQPNDLPIGSVTYWGASVGYAMAPTKTGIRVGIDNAFDKQPPLLYQNNVINANTDVNTYDTIGTFYWLKVTQGF